jgi:hypothetical protein
MSVHVVRRFGSLNVKLFVVVENGVEERRWIKVVGEAMWDTVRGIW